MTLTNDPGLGSSVKWWENESVEDAVQIVAKYEEVLLKAQEIAAADGNDICDRSDMSCMRLTICGKTANLYNLWVETGFYEPDTNGEETFSFPVELLSATEETIAQWAQQRKKEREERDAAADAQARAAAEARERQLLKSLKAKYESDAQ